MKKIFLITLILCLTMPLCGYAVNGSDFDADKDGDVDGEDLSGFAEYFGKLCWYKDADVDGYSDGTKVWAVSRPEDYYYLADELISLWVDQNDGDDSVKPVWDDNYTITSSDDVQALSGYAEVTGNLEIGGGVFYSLQELEALISVGGDLVITNYAFPNLSGLDNLTSVGGNLHIHNNAALTSLSGLENIDSVGAQLAISGNAILASLSGLDNLTSVGGNLAIIVNATLTSLGLPILCSVNNDFNINSNTNLCENLAEDLRDQVLACSGGGIGGTIYIFANKICL